MGAIAAIFRAVTGQEPIEVLHLRLSVLVTMLMPVVIVCEYDRLCQRLLEVWVLNVVRRYLDLLGRAGRKIIFDFVSICEIKTSIL